MNRRTAQNQRKVRFPNLIRRRPKKETTEQPVVKSTVEAEGESCKLQGCGCGN